MILKITSSTLLLYGVRGRFFLKYRSTAEANLRNSRTVVLPDASGFPVQENPKEAVGELLRFFA